jgi:hypothetical protein
MTYLEAALEVLKSSRKPLTTREITNRAVRNRLIVPQGKTPDATMAAVLYRQLSTHTLIVKTAKPGPARAKRGTVRWALRKPPGAGRKGLFDVFWWVSAMSRVDTRDTQAYVQIRGVPGISRAVPPEVATTFNLVRRLAGRRHITSGLTIALHSGPLEGGDKRTGRAASGADLELAVEVAFNVWIDLTLQAKRFNPGTGKYDEWKPSQNKALIDWVRLNGRRGGGHVVV